MKRLKTALQSRYLIKVITIIIVTASILITNVYPSKSKYSGKETKITGRITSIQINGDKLTIIIKEKEKLMVNFFFKNKKEKQYYQKNLQLGDKIKIKGKMTLPPNPTLPNQFNYKKYLEQQHIYYIIKASSIEKVENNTSLLYELKNRIIKRINKIDTTGYIKTFLLGDKSSIEEEILSKYQDNGISHLFAISGMHITLITSIILSILKKLTYNNYIKYSIVTIILLFYLFLTGNSPSIIRTVVLFIITSINLCFNLKIKSIDEILLTLSIICIINPYLIYNVGFQFSYTISFFLILFSNKTKGKKKLISNLYTSYICFLVSLPICINYFYQINILSCIYNLIMIPLVSTIIFPSTIIIFFIPKLNSIYKKIILILETLNNIFGNIKVFTYFYSKPSLYIIVIMYILIFLSLKDKKYLLLLITFLIGYYYFPRLDTSYQLTIIDVGQGDSLLITYPHKKNTILIDTGGKISEQKEEWQKRKKEFSYITSKTIPYLKSIGIRKVNYLVLTHGDYDHMGEAINLVNNFKVEKVIFNCGAFNDLESELIKVLDKKNINYYSCIKELNIDKNKLYFLQTKVYDNENDNSNVIITELNGYKFMFMGDASSNTEHEILNKYNLPNIDVLKVGHHGSRTSSSKEFINEINPKYSVISVGKNNRYGHPNKEVLDNLNDSKVYRTDQDGSIMLKIKNNKLKIETCSP